MKKVVVSLVSAAALATITAGMAATTKSTVATSSDNFFNNSASGVYVSGNLGYGFYNEKKGNYVNKKDRHSLAWNVNVGYQLNPYFAVEAGYIDFANIKVSQNGNAVKAKLSGVDLLAKGIMPINDQFGVFAKAGMVRLDGKLYNASATEKAKHHVVPALGLGVSYNLNKQVALNVQDLYTMAVKNSFRQTNTVMAGVSYKFSAV